jgi:signal transduction histidine kinase
MLREDAVQGKELLDTVLRSGREILNEINRTNSGEYLPELLWPRVQEILEATAGLRGLSQTPEALSDLERIEVAARSLVEKVQAPASADIEPQPENGTARILVVDDNPGNRNVLVRRLRRDGYIADEAADGREALEALRDRPYDLLLLDILMPVMDGFEVLSRLKADRRLRSLPVIVISAVDELDGAIRSIEMGAEDYLFKPFDPVLLRARINASIEKRNLRAELVVQEKLASLGAFTAGIAHEIKNPLNFVTNFAQLSGELARHLRECLEAQRSAIPEAALNELLEIATDLEQNVDRIREHGERADSIVRSMLAHSRAGTGERRQTDINALVREFVNLAFHGIRAQDVNFQASIQYDLDPAAPSIDAVPQDLSRVFLNIASNAFYAVRKRARSGDPDYKPEVRISTAPSPGGIVVRIRDNGTGIPEAMRARVFDPFFTTKPSGEGTGLGLSISHEIVVQEHGGDMTVDSVEGEYTEFSIVLPARAPTAETETA